MSAPIRTTEQTAQACTAILDELERAVVGRRRTLELVLIGILAGGHVLLEDLPGLGKTLIARSFARVLGLDFARIQFTPDLLPSDVVGAPLYDQRSAEMVFRPGPVFTQLLLADEINRTPPKTQAALLEAMGEGQVSVDGLTRRLPEPFIVLATDNPIEYEGTYELPEAQLDRFLMRLRLGYLTTGDETAMLKRRVEWATEYTELKPVTTADGVLAMRESLERVEVTGDLLDYIVAIVTATRQAEGHAAMPLPRIDCYPAAAEQRTRVVLRRLPNRLGEHPARVSGEGIEFFGVRDYVPGDRQRSINWPASTRRGRLQVNTFAAERSQDVVLLADATSDVGEPGMSALDLALRGAAAAARAYTEARDRVGVITYQWGGASWLAPGLGRRQVYRIIDSMLASDAGWARGASFRRLPRAALPPGALVVVFGPLLDQRFVETLRDMRERAFTMLVVDVLNAEPPARQRILSRGGLGGRPPGLTPTGWPGGSGGWSRRRSGSRCASSASRWCTGTGWSRWTSRWPRIAGGRWRRADERHCAGCHRRPPRRRPARGGLRRVGDGAAGTHGRRGLRAVPGDLRGGGGGAAARADRGSGAGELLPAVRGATRLGQLPGHPPIGPLGGGRAAGRAVARGAAPVPAVAHRDPRRRAHRLPAGHAPSRIRRIPPGAAAAGPRAGGRRGPARARRGRRDAPGGRTGSGFGTVAAGGGGRAHRRGRPRPAVRHARRRAAPATSLRPKMGLYAD